ncbi:hypothetical protein OSL57_27800, partial [Escherichia coli]|nr:hypothetical protein [Escherichia coli]
MERADLRAQPATRTLDGVDRHALIAAGDRRAAELEALAAVTAAAYDGFRLGRSVQQDAGTLRYD